MDREPKRLIARIVETAALLAFASFLLRLAVRWLSEIWIALLVVLVIVCAGVIAFRIWRSRGKW